MPTADLDARGAAGPRSSRDVFSVTKEGVEDKWWFLTVNEDDVEAFTLRLESPAGQFWEAKAPDAWHALRALREQVEPLGYWRFRRRAGPFLREVEAAVVDADLLV